MGQLQDANVVARRAKALLQLRAVGVVLHDFKSFAAVEPAGLVGVAVGIASADRYAEARGMVLVDHQQSGACPQARSEVGQESAAILLPDVRPPQMRHPQVEPPRCVRQAPGVRPKQRDVLAKVSRRRDCQRLDINAETLAIAAARNLGEHVTLLRADAWCLPDTPRRFDLGMAHLWWSHVRKQDRGRFLSHFASRLRARATLLMIDQNHAPGFGVPVSRRDADGNTYQTRWLDSGERFEVVKNYPDRAELEQSLGPACDDVRILQLTHFWAVSASFRPVP